MTPIKTLPELVTYTKKACKPKRIAVSWAQDDHTLGAVSRAVSEGLVSAMMIGRKKEISAVAHRHGVDPGIFTIIESDDPQQAVKKALSLVKKGEADILMKGLVGTDIFLKEVIHKDYGLLPEGNVLSYVCALQIPGYHKLLFITDTAVIPYPDLKQKTAMTRYAIDTARHFGVKHPFVALIEATEKVSNKIPSTIDDAMICKMAAGGIFGECTVDGPMDVFLACDREATEIKQVPNRIAGKADVLVFPSLAAANVFYKGLVHFSGASLAGLLQGTQKPVVVMSRSESVDSKFYCIALAVLEANNKE